MSTDLRPAQSTILDEDTFNELYDNVWAGYDDHPATLMRYGGYSPARGEPDHPGAPNQQGSHGGSFQHSPSAQSVRVVRPLPPTPPIHSASGSSSNLIRKPSFFNTSNIDLGVNRPLPTAPRPPPIDGNISPPYHYPPGQPIYPNDHESYNYGDSGLPQYGNHNLDPLLPNPIEPDLNQEHTPHTTNSSPGQLEHWPSPTYSHRPQPQVTNASSEAGSVHHQNGTEGSEYQISPIDSPPGQIIPRSPSRRWSVRGVSPIRPSSFSSDNGNLTRHPTYIIQSIIAQGPEDRWEPLNNSVPWDSEYEDSEIQFANFSLLSHLAVGLRDKVPRGTHVKGSIPYPEAFTGKDIVSSIHSQIRRELMDEHGGSSGDRRAALQVARSLQNQLFFYEVEWGSRMLQDGVEDVYMFLDDHDSGSDAPPEREELPTGVITILAKCYSPSCGEGPECYAYSCPRKGDSLRRLLPNTMEAPLAVNRDSWPKTVPPEVLRSLPDSEINRQIIIHKLISKEGQYVQDLDIVDSVFIKPLRVANPPVIPSYELDKFLDDVFGNILDLRDCAQRLLEVMYVRQREQAPVIQRIGDIFLDAATRFRSSYPLYIGRHPVAEKRMRDELERNPEFRLFIERCSRQSLRPGETLRLDLRHFLNRPAEHLQKYPVLLQAILNETVKGNPDADYLREAIAAIKNLQTAAQLRTFQSAMGKGVTSKWEWNDVTPSPSQLILEFTPGEMKRQKLIFELIKGEMAYVKDLENIETMFVHPLRNAEPPIIPFERLDNFMFDVFHNFAELYAHHRRLLDTLHEIQREEHPRVRIISEPIFDAALNFREAYMEYIPNYPIAAYKFDDEMDKNDAFRVFVHNTRRIPDSRNMSMKDFVNTPISRLHRYEVLLKGIFDETPRVHDDRDSIPHVIDLIKTLVRDSEPGVLSAKQRVSLWTYNSNLIFKPMESLDMDLLNEQRSLIHTGKLLRQPDSKSEWSGWIVMTRVRELRGVLKYHVDRRPIPLDLLSLVKFTDKPVHRGTGVLLNRSDRRTESSASSSNSHSESGTSGVVYPFTIHHNGRLGGPCTLYADTAKIRLEWKQKLDEALGLRKVVQESNKVFEGETLSIDTFNAPPSSSISVPSWGDGSTITGKVTCSIPFNTPDGRHLVAIGCAEGVWIGFRHDSQSMRRVLHLKMVTQCTMLDDFGLFLVLADKNLFAYHIEALVPASPTQTSNASPTPKKLNENRKVEFFSVGNVLGHTYVIYMRKRGNDSYFQVLEPVIDRINDRAKTPGIVPGFLRKSEWFRPHRQFFLTGDSYDLVFLKAKIGVLCAKGFEIMNLTGAKSVTIPLRDDARFEPLAKRFDTCRPVGMFRIKENEYLLCYNEFGIYVNKHGDPTRLMPIVEWEGTAESVAFHPPYILLFDPRFIEIRHAETGRLAQFIHGNDIRCIWDGRGLTDSALALGDVPDDQMAQEARVHAAMKLNDSVQPNGRQLKPVAQHVFELIPTIPLYLPGSLASPTNAMYFPTSLSPPHSPQPRSTYRMT